MNYEHAKEGHASGCIGCALHKGAQPRGEQRLNPTQAYLIKSNSLAHAAPTRGRTLLVVHIQMPQD